MSDFGPKRQCEKNYRARIVFNDGIDHEIAQKRWHEFGLPTPTLTIASGHGVHAYWRLAEPITDLALWSMLQKRLITLLDSDAAIHDPARIMRLPGFTNHKAPAAACQIIDADARRTYDLGTLISLLYCVVTESDFAAQYQAGCRNTGQSKTPFRSDTSAGKIDKLVAAKWLAVKKGVRNCKAFQNAAYLLKNLGLTEGQAWPILRHWNCKNKPPLPEWELRQALRNANTYGRHLAEGKIMQRV